MKKLAIIILNRNLPKVTDNLYNKLKKSNKETDIYILKSGSNKKLLSKNYSWHAGRRIAALPPGGLAQCHTLGLGGAQEGVGHVGWGGGDLDGLLQQGLDLGGRHVTLRVWGVEQAPRTYRRYGTCAP